MKGCITVESQVNVGSTFVVTLPNVPKLSHETSPNNLLLKSQSQFSRFNVVLCSQNFEMRSSWRHRIDQLYEFTEKIRQLGYNFDQKDYFELPQEHESLSKFIKTYFVYDVSILTTENINDLKNANMMSYENSLFVYHSNTNKIHLHTLANLPTAIFRVHNCETLTNSIHHSTKELLAKLKSQYSILIVDDDDFNRKIFSVFLAKEGYNIYTAQNGQEGYEVFCEHADNIKMVVVDYEMPICDGPTCAEKILKFIKDQNMTPVPIHALTGNVSQESIARIAQAGIKKAWNKPAKLEEIMDEIFYLIVKSGITA